MYERSLTITKLSPSYSDLFKQIIGTTIVFGVIWYFTGDYFKAYFNEVLVLAKACKNSNDAERAASVT